MTIRNPEDSTNAACNIHGGKRKTKMLKETYHDTPRSKIEIQNGPSSFVPTIAFVERFALFGNSTLVLIVSLVLLVVAVVIYMSLENAIDDEKRIE